MCQCVVLYQSFRPVEHVYNRVVGSKFRHSEMTVFNMRNIVCDDKIRVDVVCCVAVILFTNVKDTRP